MIKNFKHKGLELFHKTGKVSGIQAKHKKPFPYFANAHTGYQQATEQIVARMSVSEIREKSWQHK